MKHSQPKYILLTVGILTLLAACKHNSEPKGLMDTATLANFLTEAHIIEGYSEAIVPNKQDSIRINAAYDSLYAKYNITPADYDSSMVYYSHHPDLLEAVYERVTKNLKKIRDSYPSTNKENIKQSLLPDSIGNDSIKGKL